MSDDNTTEIQLTRQVSLGEIFDPKQLAKVTTLINQIRARKINSYKLREYLESQSAALDKKGINATYLYYMLCYKFELL